MITYARFNSSRRPQYRLGTYIVSDSGRKFVRKVPLVPEAQDFLHTLYQNFLQLRSVELPFELVQARIVNTEVEFDFCDGALLDGAIYKVARSGDDAKLSLYLGKYANVIDSLPNAESEPDLKKWREIFKDVPIPKECRFITPGLIDLNFDNLILSDSQKWTLIDYEWIAPCPLPRDYVVGRAICGWYLSILSSGLWKRLALRDLLLEAGIQESFLPTLLKMEQAFQNYVVENYDFTSQVEPLLKQDYRAYLEERLVGQQSSKSQAKSLNEVILELSKKQAWILKLEEAITAKDAWARKLEEAIAAKDAWIEKLNKDISELKAAIEKNFKAQ